jgi:hypothetical protein
MAPVGRTCTQMTMAKPTEPDDVLTKGNLSVLLCNGTEGFHFPAFPSINASARARANAFTCWEKQARVYMHLQVPVEEILGQLDHHVPIETEVAQMKMDLITDEVYGNFFKIANLQGSNFCDKYHEEASFGNSLSKAK